MTAGVDVVEVFADIVCPFAHVGLRRLVEARTARGLTAPRLRIRSWPLELVNGVPVDPHHIAAEIDDLRAQVAPDLFTDFRVDAFPASSLPALALAAAANDVGDDVGEAVGLALRTVLFEAGRNPSDPGVIAEIAAAHGLTVPTSTARVEADWADGRARGVIGSPHFFVGDDDFFCPTLEITREGEHFKIRRDPARLAAVLDACFGP